jgi:tRNA U34 2-thiouridine synthase MnmA/TrmU
VRELADQYLLPTRHRKDSQGICFLGKLKFDEFIAHYLGASEGPIRCYQTGKMLGTHRGLWFHTIGQRKGLGPYLDSVVHLGPWYVASKDPATNALYVTNNLGVVDRPRIEFRVHRVNWVGGEEPAGMGGGMRVELKLRHGPTLVGGTVTTDEGREGVLRVVLDRKDKGIAPGQFAAFYAEMECLGAGVVYDNASDGFLGVESGGVGEEKTSEGGVDKTFESALLLDGSAVN